MSEETLAARVRRLQEEARASQQKSSQSRGDRVREDVRTSARFLYQVSQGFAFLWDWVGRPLGRLLASKSRWLWRQYRRLWAFTVYQRTALGGLRFSKARAAGIIVATFLFVWYGLLPVLECAYEASLYVLTARVDERLYLLGSQEINSTMGTHVIEGCRELPCSDQDAVYFRTENTVFNNLWSLYHGRGWFFAEYVGAAVPNNTSRCVTTSYGIRFRFTSRFLNIYPHMLALTCTTIDGSHR